MLFLFQLASSQNIKKKNSFVSLDVGLNEYVWSSLSRLLEIMKLVMYPVAETVEKFSLGQWVSKT